jgi:hypothetical protein
MPPSTPRLRPPPGVAAQADERGKLERLCRYISRTALATLRLSLSAQGHIRYAPKTPYRDGTTHVVFEPLDFLSHLAALVPLPRVNLTRFHGVFAPHHSVAKSGAHVMYGNALAGFGFALDTECKNNSAESLLDALSVIKPDSKNPMDLTQLECETFAARHLDLVKSDAESADTIMMWLFGFAVAKSGGHVFDAGALSTFESALMGDCKKYPGRNLFDALTGVKFGK